MTTAGTDLARAWASLEEELDGDREAVERFVLAWSEHLEERLTAVGYALAAGDEPAARTTLSTLRQSSRAVGAHHLAALAGRALRSLDSGAQAAASVLLPARSVADDTLRVVATQLLAWHARTARAQMR
ncbi:hypothetical protein GCM10009718_24670 [Isoptericola halotolerans]|uniref:Hpt domain-containing protein n=1 Tax=Isoptericola halotolerans TaxID=300560 RepID=A0ABX2A7S4_9MICO|nr:hypothetical protein [Isoptericola halotolerans]NOV97968.1 hypothetical protein [Isoptericola halotolerans]